MFISIGQSTRLALTKLPPSDVFSLSRTGAKISFPQLLYNCRKLRSAYFTVKCEEHIVELLHKINIILPLILFNFNYHNDYRS